MNTIMKNSIVVILLLSVNIAIAQKLDDNYLTTITQSIYSPNFDNAQKSLDLFFQENNV